jgi:hypothetical protein
MAWKIIGESVAGTSHHRLDVPCQDAFACRAFGEGDEWLVLALSDGAGSASQSALGAHVACKELVRLAQGAEPYTLHERAGMVSLFAAARDAVRAAADVPPRELACTALLAVVGPGFAVFAQVGDGALVVGDGSEYRVVFWPEPAEYANATDFLTDAAFADALRLQPVTTPVIEVAALSDGLQRLALDFKAREAHAGFFRPLFDRLRDAADPEALREPLRQFLCSERVNQRTDDDKSLVLTIRSSQCPCNS